MRNGTITENGERLSGTWDHQPLPYSQAVPRLSILPTAKHICRDPMVAVWIGILLILMGMTAMLWQHQKIDRSVTKIQSMLLKSEADRHEIHHEIEEVKAVATP